MATDLTNLLECYAQFWLQAPQSPVTTYQRFVEFVAEGSSCYQRHNLAAHVTASSLVVDPTGEQVLLLHHRKLDKWLQPGGHADGNPDVLEVARQEVAEECGLEGLQVWGYDGEPQLWDLDIHAIPRYGDTPSHEHFDACFLMVADPAAPLQLSDESHQLRWFTIEDARKISPEQSLGRQFNKLQVYVNNGGKLCEGAQHGTNQ